MPCKPSETETTVIIQNLEGRGKTQPSTSRKNFSTILESSIKGKGRHDEKGPYEHIQTNLTTLHHDYPRILV